MLLLLLLITHQGAPLELRELDEAVARHPDHARLYVERAEFLRTLGRFDDALTDLDVAEALGADAAMLRARIHAMRGESELAEHFATAALPAPEAFFLRGKLREADGRLPEARADYRAAVRGGAGVDVQLARFQLEQRMGALDVEALVAAVDQTRAAVLVRLLAEAGPVEQALPRLDRLIAQARVKTDWLLLRAQLHARAGRAAEAAADRRLALVEARRLVAKRPAPATRAALRRAEEAVR